MYNIQNSFKSITTITIALEKLNFIMMCQCDMYLINHFYNIYHFELLDALFISKCSLQHVYKIFLISIFIRNNGLKVQFLKSKQYTAVDIIDI